MSELEKKDKTGNFIKDLALRYDSANKHLWVMLEDAQEFTQELEQQVKNLETNRDNLLESLEICARNLKLLCKESVEFKQKLQESIEEIKRFYGYECQACIILKNKFEELLKEAEKP